MTATEQAVIRLQRPVDALIDSFLSGEKMFLDQNGTPFIKVTSGDSQHTAFSLESLPAKDYLRMKARFYMKRALSGTELAMIIEELSANARQTGYSEKVWRRCGKSQDTLFYDLANAAGEVVMVKPSHWEINRSNEINFSRYDCMREQVRPLQGGDWKKLWNFTNLNSEEDKLLLVVLVASMLVPDIQHPILSVDGVMGSGKSTFLQVLKRLLDPSYEELQMLPIKAEDLALQLERHHFLAFDNLSHLPKNFSDILCQAVTGGTYSKRKLYSNAEIYTVHFSGGNIAVNGINRVVNRADLVDRSIMFELTRLSPDKLKGNQSFWDRFQSELPSILGGMFDLLSNAMKLLPDIEVRYQGRMTDFQRWGVAITQAMGYSKDHFTHAYGQNLDNAFEEISNSHPLCQAVERLLSEQEVLVDTIGNIHLKLTSIANELGISSDPRWPKHSNLLAKQFKELQVNFELSGIEFQILDRTCAGRKFLIKRLKK